MLDGAELAEAIASHPNDIEAAFTEYEEIMFVRSENEALAARATIDLIFGAGAPMALANLFNGTEEQPGARAAERSVS